MASCTSDILALSDFAAERLRGRMTGLTDAEWQWSPTSDPRITVRWRLAHICDFLREDRNRPWLGMPAMPVQSRPAVESATAALADVGAAYSQWRDALASLHDADLDTPIGDVGGPFAAHTRRSFALHLVDELIHHSAEAALLRDLYAGRV